MLVGEREKPQTVYGMSGIVGGDGVRVDSRL